MKARGTCAAALTGVGGFTRAIHQPSVAAWRRGYWFLIAATVLSVAVADWLFYGHPVGWTADLFTAFVLALLTLRGGPLPPDLARLAGPPRGRRLGRGAGRGADAARGRARDAGASMLPILNHNAWPGGTRLWALRLVEGIGFALVRVVTGNRVALRWLRRRPMPSIPSAPTPCRRCDASRRCGPTRNAGARPRRSA